MEYNLEGFRATEALLYRISRLHKTTLYNVIANIADLFPMQETWSTWETIGSFYGATHIEDDELEEDITLLSPSCSLLTEQGFYCESNIINLVDYSHNIVRLLQGRQITKYRHVELVNCPNEINPKCRGYIIGEFNGRELLWLVAVDKTVVYEYAIGTFGSLFQK